MKKLTLTTFAVALFTTMAFSQELTQKDYRQSQTEKQKVDLPCTIGSSLWVLSNFLDDPDHFYQLNFGYQFTPKDNIIVEALTWTYDEPLGEYGSAKEGGFYPGRVKAYGLGLGYQRFHWKKLFTTVQATNFLQKYYDEDDKEIQKGYQLYLQLIAGYRFEFFKKRFYIEPAYSFRYWPVNTNFPESFAAVERGKPNYKIEPSLNVGFRF